MASATCPVCSNNNTSIFIEGIKDVTFKTTTEEFNVYNCADCSAKFQHPFIPENVVGKYYPTSYHPFQLGDTVIPLNLKYNPQSIYLRNLISRYKPNETFSLIDIGCGGGTFLMSVKKHFPNAQLMGVDVSDAAIQNLKKAGIEGICDSLYNFETDKKFDYISSSQVLEHLNKPYEFLDKIKSLSTAATIIMIDVPASDSYSAKKYGKNWVHWDLPRHSILYSIKTFQYLMKDFQTIELRHAGSIAAIFSSYKLSKDKDIYQQSASEKLFQKTLSPLAKLFGWDFLFSDKLIWIGKLKS
ncbi:MAG TPA: class I SAM-dependent methyltransferase [Bacteroidia bacterium]|jgi:SAM-dependent methyltransferase